MAGGPTVQDRRVLLPAFMTLLFGLLALSGSAEPSGAAVATADGERASCLVRCVGPSGIRWDEAVVDSAALLR
jgi:hypothetical protein